MLGLGCLTPDGFEPRQLKNAPSAVSFGHFAMLSDGDLLMSRANTRDLVGLAGTYRDIGTPCIYPDLMMRLTLTQGWSAKALEVVLRSPRARRQISALAQGTSESMVKISGQSVKTVSVPELSVAEQAQLVGVVRNFEEQVTQDRRKLIKLRQLKQGLTSDLLSGRGACTKSRKATFLG
jgi:TusA-related sulfurtransferase